jgi:hypothetical protein
MILDYLSPVRIYRRLTIHVKELINYRTFKKIILELNDSGKLDEIGIKADPNSNMYIGINLNPELLLYSDASQESVELKLISEKMNKYNDFLTKEGILDSIKVDYERIQTEEHYGYVLQISFNFNKYKKSDFIYGISYFSVLLLTLIAGIFLLFNK